MATDFEKKRRRHLSGESTMSNDSVSNYIPTPPDGGWGWVIVFASFINHVVVDGITFTFGVFYLDFLDYFKASKSKTSLVGSLLAGFYLMSGPIASALTNRFGCRPVCVAGSLFASLAFVLSTLSPNIDVLMLTYGVMAGIGFGLIYLPSIVSVSYYFERRRALATGIAVCGAGVGGFIFAPAGKMMLERFDWKNAMYIVAGITLNSAVCGMLMRPLEGKKKVRRKNFLDRWKEKAFGRSLSVDNQMVHGVNQDVVIKERLKQAKLLREQMIRDEDGESEPPSCLNSVRVLEGLDSRSPSRTTSFQAQSRQNSLIPVSVKPGKDDDTPSGPLPLPIIVFPDEEKVKTNGHAAPVKEVRIKDERDEKKDSLCENEDDDKSKMLSIAEEEEANEMNTRKSSSTAALPAHIRREMGLSDREDLGLAEPASMLQSSALGENYSLPSDAFPTSAFEHNSSRQQLDTVPEGVQTDMLLPGEQNGRPLSISVGNIDMGEKPSLRTRKPKGVHKTDYARPLYRRDIFYSGSIIHIPEFRSQPDVNQYVTSITAIPDEIPPDRESRCWKFLPIPKTAKDVLRQMLDFSLLKDPVFLIICLGDVFGFIGLFIPFVFITERAMALGVTDTRAAFLLSVIGITNTIGRILVGWISDFPRVNSLLLHNLMMIIGGIACIMNMFCNTYPLMVVFAAVFGFSVATYISLTSIILCNLMGLEKLTSSFGFLTLVRGLASIAGPPAAGFVFDKTNNYDMSFHVGGAMFVIAGLMYCILHLPYFHKEGANIQPVMQQDVNIPHPDEMDDISLV